MLRDGVGKLFRGACASRGEGDVNTLEVVVVLKEFHFVFLATKRIFRAGTTLRAEKEKFVDGEITLSQHPQEFLSHGTACTYYCYFHFYSFLRIMVLTSQKSVQKYA